MRSAITGGLSGDPSVDDACGKTVTKDGIVENCCLAYLPSTLPWGGIATMPAASLLHLSVGSLHIGNGTWEARPDMQNTIPHGMKVRANAGGG